MTSLAYFRSLVLLNSMLFHSRLIVNIETFAKRYFSIYYIILGLFYWNSCRSDLPQFATNWRSVCNDHNIIVMFNIVSSCIKFHTFLFMLDRVYSSITVSFLLHLLSVCCCCCRIHVLLAGLYLRLSFDMDETWNTLISWVFFVSRHICIHLFEEEMSWIKIVSVIKWLWIFFNEK